MFSDSGNFSQLSNADYCFNMHNDSQSVNQFDLYDQNKNQNFIINNELDTINEEKNFTPIRLNIPDSPNNNNANNLKLDLNQNKTGQMKFIPDSNKENAPQNISSNAQGGINFDTYKFKLSQQIDKVEKIATQSMGNKDTNNINTNNCKNNLEVELSNNDEISQNNEQLKKYYSDLIDNILNKNIEYIDGIKKSFNDNLDGYKSKLKDNVGTIKKLFLLYADDVFKREKNKIAISNLANQVFQQINSFFVEMNKCNINLNILNNQNIKK